MLWNQTFVKWQEVEMMSGSGAICLPTGTSSADLA
jgi:hypothetical protein